MYNFKKVKKYQRRSWGPIRRGAVRARLSEEVAFKVRPEDRGIQPGEGRRGGRAAFQMSVPEAKRMGGVQSEIYTLRCPHAGWKHRQQWNFSCTRCKEHWTMSLLTVVQAWLCQSAA